MSLVPDTQQMSPPAPMNARSRWACYRKSKLTKWCTNIELNKPRLACGALAERNTWIGEMSRNPSSESETPVRHQSRDQQAIQLIRCWSRWWKTKKNTDIDRYTPPTLLSRVSQWSRQDHRPCNVRRQAKKMSIGEATRSTELRQSSVALMW